jgi:FlaA1/EpsC-like NDP-sugar epimerase
MPAVKVIDVARAISDRFQRISEEAVKIEISGLRPGEKLHEELFTMEELNNAFRCEDLLILAGGYGHLPPETPVKSSQPPVLSSKDQQTLAAPEILQLVRTADHLNLLKWEIQP